MNLTENVRQKVKAIQNMFCDDDSDMMSRHQEATLSMAEDSVPEPASGRPYIHGTAAANTHSQQQKHRFGSYLVFVCCGLCNVVNWTQFQASFDN